MSQYQSQPFDIVGRNRPDPMGSTIPRVPLQTDLNAPGVVAPPPDMQAAQMAADLSNALNGTARLAGTVGSLAAEANTQLDRQDAKAEYLREKAQREREQRERDAEVFDKGQASLNWRMLRPRLVDDFATGKRVVADGATEEDAVNDIVAAYTEGHSPAYTEAFRQHAPELLDDLIRQSKDRRVTGQRENLILAGQAAAQTDTPEALADVVRKTHAASPDLSESEVLQRTALYALKTAADNTTDPDSVVQARFNAAKTFLKASGRFTELLPAAEADMNRSLTQRAAAREQAAKERIAGEMLGDHPQEYLAGLVESERRAGNIDNQTALQYTSGIDAKIAREQAEAQKAWENAQAVRVTEAIAQDSVAKALSGTLDQDPVTGAVLDKTEIKVGEQTVSVSAADKMRQGIDGAFSVIDSRLPPGSPENWGEKVRVLDRNNAVSVPLKQRIASAAAQMNPQTLADPVASQEAVAGFTDFVNLYSRSTSAAIRSTDGDAFTKMWRASLYQKYIAKTNDVRPALLAASKMSAAEAGGRPSVYAFSTNPNSEFYARRPFSGAKNASDIMREYEAVTRLLIEADGHDEANASREASELIEATHVEVNGYQVYVGPHNEALRSAIERQAPRIIDEWVKQNPGAGVSADDLAVSSDPQGNIYIVNAAMGSMAPAMGDKPLPVFSRGQMLALDNQWAAEENARRIKREADISKALKEGKRLHADPWGVLQGMP